MAVTLSPTRQRPTRLAAATHACEPIGGKEAMGSDPGCLPASGIRNHGYETPSKGQR
jgi:hypothetical protein